MQLNLDELSPSQKKLIINRLYDKFKDRDIGLKNVALFIELYRRKRYESGVIKILEGDEILKGKIYGVSREVIDKNKENTHIVLGEKQIKEVPAVIKDNFEVEYEETSEKESFNLSENNLSEEEKEDLEIARKNRAKLNSLRGSLIDNKEYLESDSSIIFDDNIIQEESEFTLREINNQLPKENLLDKYNFGYINLLDDNDGTKRDSIGKRII